MRVDDGHPWWFRGATLAVRHGLRHRDAVFATHHFIAGDAAVLFAAERVGNAGSCVRCAAVLQHRVAESSGSRRAVFRQPGRGAFNIARISIASVELDGPVSSAVVPPSGALASAPDRNTAVWYDFSHWPGLGGLPDAGGNIVMAGDAGRIGEGTGIFAKLGRVSPGSFVRLQLTSDGPACYRLEWNKLAAASLDFSSIVQATASESVTLIGRTHRR